MQCGIFIEWEKVPTMGKMMLKKHPENLKNVINWIWEQMDDGDTPEELTDEETINQWTNLVKELTDFAHKEKERL
ncbi:MAG: hypothetical protein J6Y55_09035 [Bacteroidales bacterium]|nr:hypothetical protein [Bacteroidales bacterium]